MRGVPTPTPAVLLLPDLPSRIGQNPGGRCGSNPGLKTCKFESHRSEHDNYAMRTAEDRNGLHILMSDGTDNQKSVKCLWTWSVRTDCYALRCGGDSSFQHEKTGLCCAISSHRQPTVLYHRTDVAASPLLGDVPSYASGYEISRVDLVYNRFGVSPLSADGES